MEKLLMNEKEYIDGVVKKAKANKDDKIFSYDFKKIISLLVKREITHEELSEKDIEEIKKQTEHNFKHHMNYCKEDKNKEFPKKSKEEIYYIKMTKYINDKYKDVLTLKIKKIMKDISHNFNELQWEKFITSNVKNQIIYNRKLKQIDKLYFSEDDLKILNKEVIDDVGNVIILSDTEKRLMFTYMIIAKYYNQEEPCSANINISVNNMFKFANMGSMKKKFKKEMMGKLQNMGLIKLNFYNRGQKRDLSYKVLECDSSNENNKNVFFISGKSNDENLLMDIGKKYKDMIKLFNNNKIKQCERCGEPIEVTTSNNKYCSECAKEIIKQRDRERKNPQASISESIDTQSL